MSEPSIKVVLSGVIPAGTKVSIKGWVRTRRDSKAGFSFIAVSDGSCQSTIQVVAPNELDNYVDEIQSLTTGCSVICSGTLVESQGRGQAFEV
ncbi:MAG: asparaginyl-tRNA synthetase, partial [Lysobacterales bacterium]